MKHPFSIILCITACLSVLSCIKETSRSDAFEASFTLDTDTVYDGDEFGFTVKCNRSQFKIVSFEFPLSPGLLEPNATCSTRDGVWTLRERVSVPQSQRGRLSLSIQDTETGLVKEFSALYTAYASSGLSLLIENEAVSSKMITAGLPTVVGGDDFVFSLRGKAERLIIESFDCEFNDGILSVGGEILLSGGAASFRIPAVSAADDFSPKTLSLTLLNPETGRDTTVTASYVKASRFAPGVTLADSRLIQGETATVRLTANRPLFHLKEYTAPSWFVLKDYSPDAPEVALNIDGYATLVTSPLDIDKNGSGNLNFELFDSEYTRRSVIVSVPYTATVRSAPGNVSLSASDLKLCTGETASVTVSTTTAHSTGLFTAKILSGEGKVGLYAPTSSEPETPDEISPDRYVQECAVSDGRLFLRGMEDKWGDVTVRVCAKGNEKVYKDVRIYLRRDVALRLKGYFYEYIHPTPDDIDDIFSDVGGIGWHGFPRSVEAELVSVENRSSRDLLTLKKDEVSTYVRCFSLSDGSSSPLSASFVVSVGNKVTSNFFYAPYKSYPDPRGRLLTGTDISRVVSRTLPLNLNTTVTESRVYGNRLSCSQLLSQLRDLDCHATYQNGYGLFVMLRENLESNDHLGFGSFDVSLGSVSYDKDKYRIRYFINLCEVPGEWGEVAPWWSALGGERPWIVPYNE